jgi:hypothetical protein
MHACIYLTYIHAHNACCVPYLTTYSSSYLHAAYIVNHHTYIHAYIHTHRRIHTYMRTYIHTHTHITYLLRRTGKCLNWNQACAQWPCWCSPQTDLGFGLWVQLWHLACMYVCMYVCVYVFMHDGKCGDDTWYVFMRICMHACLAFDGKDCQSLTWTK